MFIFLAKREGLKGLFTIRVKASKRLFSEIYTVLGFWFSFFLLLFLWEVFPGPMFSVVDINGCKKQPNSGFPTTWQGRGVLSSSHSGQALSIDKMLQKAAALNLEGEVSLNLPKSPKGVYTVSNETTHFSEMKSIHFDQYTGEILAQNTWDDIGIMMKSRLWLMAFHQGKFGTWNFVLILVTALALTLLSIAAIYSYLYRPSPSGIKISGSEKEE